MADPLKRPTLEDIGKILNLSAPTISHALRERAGTVKVSAETRERVLQVAAQLGYRQNIAARALRTGKSGMIGILSFRGVNALSSWRLYSAITEAGKAGLVPLVYQADPHNETSCLQASHALIDSRVDGVLILSPGSPVFSQQHVDLLQSSRIAVTSINAPWLRGVSCFLQNKRKGFEEIGRHLVEQGYRSITLMTARLPENAKKKHYWHMMGARDGFRAVSEEARASGKAIDFRLHELNREEIGIAIPSAPDIHPLHIVGYQAMWDLIRKDRVPDALMCQVDNWALGALRACAEAGISVPGDMAITGFEGDPAGSVGSVPLTTVSHPVDETSQMAIAELIAMVQGRIGPQKRFVQIDGKLIIRKSSVRERPSAVASPFADRPARARTSPKRRPNGAAVSRAAAP